MLSRFLTQKEAKKVIDGLASGEIDCVIFLRDPMTPQPHEPDINALVRACDVHNVACATNVATAHLVLSQLPLPPKDRFSTLAGFGLAGRPLTVPPEAQIMASAMSEV